MIKGLNVGHNSLFIKFAKSEKSILLSISFFFILVSYFSSGPILEGYGIFSSRQSYWSFFPNIFGRPLALLPEYIATRVDHNLNVGYFLINALFILSKTAVIIRHTKKIRRTTRFITLIIILSMPPWFQTPNERYFPAQLAFIFLLWAILLYLNQKKFMLVNFFVFAAGMCYPPAFVTFLASLVFAKIIWPKDFSTSKICKGNIGTVVYLTYYLIIKWLYPSSYDAQSSGNPKIANILKIYKTVYFQNILTAAIIILFVLLLVKNSEILFLRRTFKACILLMVIPLSSITYASYIAYVHDKDRVLFPITAVLLMLFIILNSVMKLEAESIKFKSSFSFLDIVFVLLISFGMLQQSFLWFHYLRGNQILITTSRKLVNAYDVHTLLIKDSTNFYGDVYTLYDNAQVLSLALTPTTKIKTATICDPIQNPNPTVASRFPIPGPQRCSLLKESNYDLILTVESVIPFKYSYKLNNVGQSVIKNR